MLWPRALAYGAISMDNCPPDWPLQATERMQVCRKADGSGHWGCAAGWRRLEHLPYCRRRRGTGAAKPPIYALRPASLIIGATQAETRPDYVCVNLDFWPDAKQCREPECDPESSDAPCCPWRAASLLDTPLSALEPAIRALSHGGGLLVRMGGSLQDVVRYADHANTPGCRPFVADETRRVGFSGGCLSVARWLELHRMCERAGCRFLFGVNALSGRTRLGANLPECRAVGQISEARRRNQGRSEAERAVLAACSRWRGEWDPSELALLLKAGGARLNGTLAALSYGNELNGCKCWWEGLPAAPGTPPHW